MKNFKTLIIIGIVLVLLLICAGSGCSTYNNLVTREADVDQQWAAVQTQYQRRMDLIPNLMRTVQGYAAHESNTLEAVTRARAGLDDAYRAAADTTGAISNEEAFNRMAGNQEALNRALSIYVNAVREAYPDLKADTQFLNLQTQLEGTENRIATERTRYTDVVRDYNLQVRRFPGSIWAGIFGFTPKPQYQAEPEAAHAPEVTFPN